MVFAYLAFHITSCRLLYQRFVRLYHGVACYTIETYASRPKPSQTISRSTTPKEPLLTQKATLALIFVVLLCVLVSSPLLRATKPARAGRLCTLSPLTVSVAKKASLAVDTRTLAQLFRRQGYRPPRRGYLLVSRLVSGLGQPATQSMSLGQTGLQPSPGRYWPASTIKLWASLGALMRLKQAGLSSQSVLQFSDALGTFRGNAAALYKPMGNVEYDRLLRIAGLDKLNNQFRVKLGLQHTILRRGYGGTGRMSRSPEIRTLDQGRPGRLRATRSRTNWPTCRRNCTSLFELQEMLKRLVLHQEFPKAQRLPLSSSDASKLARSLRSQWKWVKPAITRVLGQNAIIYNKAGSVPGNHLLDNAVILSQKGRYLLTVASPWPRRASTETRALHSLNELARRGLWAIEQLTNKQSEALLPFQADTGTKPTWRLRAKRRGRKTLYQLTWQARGLDRLVVWAGKTKRNARRLTKDRFQTPWMRLPAGETLFFVRGYKHQTLRVVSSQLYRLPKRLVRCP